ncbi:MAG TPA: UDP-glucose 4-epimerase GalE [Candidatus Eremiobacteraceae bacterium]|nr:UDP-glucose 4-epimerase GalE [Candidatus Eremiobacteraceae bacterium]
MGLKVLITGGAGYIGATAVRLLLKHGHEVTAFDNLSQGHREAVPEKARLVIADLADRETLSSLFQESKFDAVMHFAASALVEESMQRPEKYFRNNVVGSLNLLECCAKHKVSRFVFSSTAATFGDPKIPLIDEDSPKNPLNPYGETKLQVEAMMHWFQKIHGVRYATLRFFNVAGAWDGHGEHHEPESHLIPIVLKVALGKRESVSVFGSDYPTPDGTCVRDYVHIYDLAMAHLLVLEALKEHEALAYNLGNGNGFSVREVIDAARKVTGRPIATVDAPRRPGDPPVLVASSARIGKELGWKPRYDRLEEIIQTAWDWHQAHPKGYGS